MAVQVGRDHPVAGAGEGRDLVPPGLPELREAVQQHHQRARAASTQCRRTLWTSTHRWTMPLAPPTRVISSLLSGGTP